MMAKQVFILKLKEAKAFGRGKNIFQTLKQMFVAIMNTRSFFT